MTLKGRCSNLFRRTTPLPSGPTPPVRGFLMQYKTLVLCASAAVLATAIACSNSPETPVSPSSSQSGSAGAGADGSTLKVSAPVPQSPVNNQQPDSLVLTASKSTSSFGSNTPLSYEFEIKNSGGTTVCNSGVVGGGSGSTVS